MGLFPLGMGLPLGPTFSPGSPVHLTEPAEPSRGHSAQNFITHFSGSTNFTLHLPQGPRGPSISSIGVNGTGRTAARHQTR